MSSHLIRGMTFLGYLAQWAVLVLFNDALLMTDFM